MSSTNETRVAEQQEEQAESPSAKQGILGNFSVSQIIASGLAAATSFALSSQIGLAGSVIGVVIGAVASAAASQIYRGILSSSAEKLRAFGSDDDEDADLGSNVTAVGNASADDERTIRREPWQPTSISGRTQVQQVSDSGTPIAPREVRHAAHARRQALIRRRVTIVTACVGVTAVLVFALVVNVATQGTGIGTTSSTQTHEVTDAAEQATDEQQGKPQQSPTSTSDEISANDQATGTAPTDTTTTDDSTTSDDTSGGVTSDTSANAGASSSDTSDTTTSDDTTSSSTGTTTGTTSNGTTAPSTTDSSVSATKGTTATSGATK